MVFWCELAAVLFSAIAYVFCFWKNKSCRHPDGMASWLSWFLLDIVTFAAMVVSKKIALQICVYTIGSLSIIVLLYKKGAYARWNRIDITCVALAVLALAAWAYTQDPFFAFVFASTGFVIGSIPIAFSAYAHPTSESLWGWYLFFFGGICGLVAKWDAWDAVTALCALYVAQQAIMCLLVLRRFLPRLAKT